jgi:oligopeptide transport system substrate-binding protein
VLRKGLLLLLVLAMAAGVLAGCTKPTVQEPDEPKVLYLPSVRPAATANIHVASLDADSEITSLITGNLYCWLPRPDRLGAELAPELAAGKPEDVNGDGTVWRISIREDAKWENGEPITADSFIYSWKMCLDPVLVNAQASSFSRNFIEIKNARAYFGQASSDPKVEVAWEDVGIKKVDDHTIELELAGSYSDVEVMRHLTMNSSGLVYEPIYEAEMNADRTATQYGTAGDKLLSSGRFKLVNWVKGAERVFEANPYYLVPERVNVDSIVYRVVEDAGTRVQMFENGELDYVGLDAEGVKTYAEDPRILPGASRYVRTMEINHTHPDYPIFANPNFRKAMYYAIDRETIAKLSNTIPAPWIVPYTSVAYSDGTLFRDLAEQAGYVPDNYGYDPELAKELFDKAMEEEGLTKLKFVMNFITTVNDHVIAAEFLQESLPQIFGADRFEIELAGLPSPQNLDNLKSSPTNPRAYAVTISQWALSAGDFAPNRIFEVYTSTYARKNGPYNCPRLDELYAESIQDEVRKDERRAAELAIEMEKVMLEELLVVPINQTTSTGLISDRVILPLDERHTSIGWGLTYADIKK